MAMSILVKVLTGLIHEQLSPVITLLTAKSQSPVHDKPFYTQFKDKIDGLDTRIKNFESTGNDIDDVKAIDALLNEAQTESEAMRSAAGKLEDEGRTMTCLANLIHRTKKVHPKLVEFALINVAYNEESPSPEEIVYLHSANYLVRGIFDPQPPTVGKQKEVELNNSLQILRAWKLEAGLIDKIDRCLKILQDLNSKNYSMSSYPSRFLKFVVGTPVGRFETELTLAMQKLEVLKKSTMESYRQGAEHKEAFNEEEVDGQDIEVDSSLTNTS